MCVFWVPPSIVFVSLSQTHTRSECKKLADQFQMDCSQCRTHTLALGLAKKKTFTLCIRPLCQSLDAYTVVVCSYYVVFVQEVVKRATSTSIEQSPQKRAASFLSCEMGVVLP